MNPPAPATPPAKMEVGFDGKLPPIAPVKPVEAKPAAPAAVEPVKEETFNFEFNGQKMALTAKQIMSLQEKAKQFDLTAKQKAELEKGVAALIAQIDTDPLGVYEKRGKDAKKLITERFKKMIEDDQLDPKERELTQLRAERDERTKKDEAVKKQQDDLDNQKKRKEVYVGLLREIDTELTKKALPKDQYTIDRLLRIMASGKRVKGSVFTVAEAADIVQREEIRHLGFIVKQLPSARLKEIFGPDIIKRLNSEEIEKLKEADAAVRRDNKAAVTDNKAKKQTEDEKKKFRREFNGI